MKKLLFALKIQKTVTFGKHAGRLVIIAWLLAIFAVLGVYFVGMPMAVGAHYFPQAANAASYLKATRLINVMFFTALFAAHASSVMYCLRLRGAVAPAIAVIYLVMPIALSLNLFTGLGFRSFVALNIVGFLMCGSLLLVFRELNDEQARHDTPV